MKNTAIECAGLGCLDVSVPNEHVVVEGLSSHSDKGHFSLVELLEVLLKAPGSVGLLPSDNFVAKHCRADWPATAASSSTSSIHSCTRIQIA